MASTTITLFLFLLLIPSLAATISSAVVQAGDLNQDLSISWGDGRGKIVDNGQLLTLSMDKVSGSGFQSKNQYLYGRFDMQVKLVPGNSAGTVTTFYLSSEGSLHDEIDFEFLGNVSGQPYIVHTNVFAQGKGDREQQFYMWFDPTEDFHTYSVLWNPAHIIFYVDGIPLREFKNEEAIGVPFPHDQPMRVYSSLWDAEDWATQGGRVKTDWSAAPFTTAFRGFDADLANVCSSSDASSCPLASDALMSQELDSTSQDKLQWVQKNYMVYNYCTDVKRFPQGLPPECSVTK